MQPRSVARNWVSLAGAVILIAGGCHACVGEVSPDPDEPADEFQNADSGLADTDPNQDDHIIFEDTSISELGDTIEEVEGGPTDDGNSMDDGGSVDDSSSADDSDTAGDGGQTDDGGSAECIPSTVCRPAAGPCDAEEICDNSGHCPPDLFQPATVLCRPAQDLCDVEERCSQASAFCPMDQRLSHPCLVGTNADMVWFDTQLQDVVRVANDCGAHWMRLPFRWNAIESIQGLLNFSAYDIAVDTLRASGVEVLGILMGVPSWANGTVTGQSDCGVSDPGPACLAIWCDSFAPLDDNTWVDFVEATVAHFSGRVKAWEIWNEENGCEFFRPRPSATRYAELLQLAYQAAKQVDPSVTVVMGGLQLDGVRENPWSCAECSQENFLDLMYQAGAKGFYDAVVIHPYYIPGSSPLPADLPTQLQATIAVMNQWQDSSPIWITEIGLNDQNAAALQSFLATTLGAASSFPQVEAFFWYRVRDFPGSPNAEYWGLADFSYVEKAGPCQTLAQAGPTLYSHPQAGIIAIHHRGIHKPSGSAEPQIWWDARLIDVTKP